MGKRDFNTWFSKFKRTLYGYEYYVDFNKVYANVEDMKYELALMNTLIGSKTIERDFDTLLKKYPEVVKCLPILIAVRLRDIKNGFEIMDGSEIHTYYFDSVQNSPEEYKTFMKRTGLFDLISNHIIGNLIDYALGVETGLDSNGRKNRGGNVMADLVESYIEKTGYEYTRETTVNFLQETYGINLSSLSNNGKAAKRFDFAVCVNGHVYGIEVNFYSSSGSKLNETARSYKMLAEESKNLKNFTFVWITDGAGWTSARNNLEETFDILDTLYCIDDLDNGCLEQLFDGK